MSERSTTHWFAMAALCATAPLLAGCPFGNDFDGYTIDAGAAEGGSGLSKCGSSWVNTSNSVSNCGSCGNVCDGPANSTPFCSSGSCGYTCESGTTTCQSLCCTSSQKCCSVGLCVCSTCACPV